MKMQTLKCLFAFGAMLAGGLAFGDGFGTPVGEASEEVVANFDTRNLKVRTPATMDEFFNVAWNNTAGWTKGGNTGDGAPSATVTIEPMSGTNREDYADWASAGTSKEVVSAPGEGADDVSSHIRRSLYKFTLAAQGIDPLLAYFDFGDAVPEVKPSVEITSVRLRDPRDGTVDYSYKVEGDFEEGKYHLIVTVSADGGTKSAVLTTKNVTAGSVTTNLNVKTLLGKAYPGVSFFAKLLPAGQLWEGGPIFAECNVGASKPEEYGYYFWWGDTVGYTNTVGEAGGSGTWVSVKDDTKTIQFSSSDETAKQTYGKSAATLKSQGYIDDDANPVLNAAYDAARAHLGAPWRMMTKAELDMLVDETVCERTWTTNWEGTGKSGYVVNGKGAYAANSVFFPAAGGGPGSSLSYSGSNGYYWSSTLYSGSDYAWSLRFLSRGFKLYSRERFIGYSVRPVRDAE